jgi:16S rRNA C1402 (ribose-2'-O) methylase RsmI
LAVGAVPGANAAVTALVLSGLPPLPFLMLGFPPPRQAARRAAFGRIRGAERAGLAATLIWYEASHRLAETLADMAEAFSDRPAAVARELTKRFEEVRRGTLSGLPHYAATAARSEITVVVGPPEQEDPRIRDACARHRQQREGRRRSDRHRNRAAAQAGLCAGIGAPAARTRRTHRSCPGVLRGCEGSITVVVGVDASRGSTSGLT